MSFWQSELGAITGSEKDAFLPSFEVIPEGTKAIAHIKSCAIVETDDTQYKSADKFIEVKYKIVSEGDHKHREVTQKIKVFNGDAKQLHRNKNMLKLLMDLCEFKPSHSGEPTNQDLAQMVGKVLGITIGEWSMTKADGGIMDGNFVREIASSKDFKCEVGIKAEVKRTPPSVGSAFSRDKERRDQLDVDIPF